MRFDLILKMEVLKSMKEVLEEIQIFSYSNHPDFDKKIKNIDPDLIRFLQMEEQIRKGYSLEAPPKIEIENVKKEKVVEIEKVETCAFISDHIYLLSP